MTQDKAHPTPAVAVPSYELLPCPFCGKRVGDDLSDILYPSGTFWREESRGRCYFGHAERKVTDGVCYSMHCTTNEGGCGAEITADSKLQAAIAWNRRATPPRLPAAQAVEEAEGARQVVEVYDKLHEGKVGQHWLWAVIEQIAAGVPEDEVLKSFGYYEKQEPCFHRPACEECAEDRALAGGAAK